MIGELTRRPEPTTVHPDIGAPRDHFAEGLRALFHGRYVIYYRATDSEIIVVRVAHASRDQRSLFGDDD